MLHDALGRLAEHQRAYDVRREKNTFVGGLVFAVVVVAAGKALDSFRTEVERDPRIRNETLIVQGREEPLGIHKGRIDGWRELGGIDQEHLAPKSR